MTDWNKEKALDLYNIAYWGTGYFDVNGSGHLVARPYREQRGGAEIDLFDLAQAAKEAGLSLPVLVRFSDILYDRLDQLCGSFDSARQARAFSGDYTAVYPIKVNQHRSVVEAIVRHGGERIGLEAGSKPELIAVLSLVQNPNTIVVCNGYKDREYVRLALIGTLLGHRVFIVVEKLSELELVIAQSRALNIKPLIGIRLRLASIGAGKWQNSGGDKAKFGLSSAQVLGVIERLRSAGMVESLQLLHFHLGSQVSNIFDINKGLREACRFYAELRALGVPIGYVDVGGGLGVDYEGSRSRSFCSINYTAEEYARHVIGALSDICDEQELPHPHVISESGRAMTAHHAMLITNVIDVEEAPGATVDFTLNHDSPPVLDHLWQALTDLPSRSPLETYHDAGYWLSDAHSLYAQGGLTLEQRAKAEQLYYSICRRIRPMLQPGFRAHREVLDELNDKLACKYFCNFSVFQSIPDVWAIDQIFPVVPLHRLLEEPTQRGVIEDLTCDSDGRIDYYAQREGIESTLPLHNYHRNEPYLLGIFLVGAYQEILGDMHNLFGDTDAVNVEVGSNGEHRLVKPTRGDKAEDVLQSVGFKVGVLKSIFREAIDKLAVGETEREGYLEELLAGIDGYTYLED